MSTRGVARSSRAGVDPGAAWSEPSLLAALPCSRQPLPRTRLYGQGSATCAGTWTKKLRHSRHGAARLRGADAAQASHENPWKYRLRSWIMNLEDANMYLTRQDAVERFWLWSLDGARKADSERETDSLLPRRITLFEVQFSNRRERSIETFHLSIRRAASIGGSPSRPVVQVVRGGSQVFSNTSGSFSITVDHGRHVAKIGPKGWVGIYQDKTFYGRGLATFCLSWLSARCTLAGLGGYTMADISLSAVDAKDDDQRERRNNLYRRLGYAVQVTDIEGSFSCHRTVRDLVADGTKFLPNLICPAAISTLLTAGGDDIKDGADATDFLQAIGRLA